MWTVLLVEDEVLVRESLIRIIPWETLGFTVVAEAGDGLEALGCIRKYEPDLVITDIIMPAMNGVELLKAAREEGYCCRFVVLSCMSDFEYVRQAMEYGASNYILKLSMNVDSLVEALGKARAELLSASHEDAHGLQRYYDNVWRKIGERIVGGREAADDSFPLPHYDRLRLSVVSVLHGSDSFDKKRLLQTAGLSAPLPQTIHTFTKWGVTTFFCWHAGEPEAQTFGQQLRAIDRAPYPAAFGSSVPLSELCGSWARVLRALDRFWYAGGAGMVHAAVGEEPAADDAGELWTMERTLIQQFEQMKDEPCQAGIARIFEKMRRQRQSMYAAKETAQRLGKTFSRMMNAPFDPPQAWVECTTHQRLGEAFSDWVREKLGQWVRTSTGWTDHPEINKVIQYIKSNYNQVLTVKGLAQFVAMDEKYLSGLFKKKTGESLIDYVHRLRIRKAEYYLRTTDLTVSEIGTMTGFSNENYFIKIFRRWSNQTPSQYRKSLKNGA